MILLKLITLIVAGLLPTIVMADDASNLRDKPYPYFKLTIPADAKLTDSDPGNSIIITNKAFSRFMNERRNKEQFFMLTLEVPIELDSDKLMLSMDITVPVFEDGVEYVHKPSEDKNAYFFEHKDIYQLPFFRKDYDRFSSRHEYTGFFQSFTETCWGGGLCFMRVKYIVPDAVRAELSYQAHFLESD